MTVTSHTEMFQSAQEVAADIARELREHPEHWIQNSLVRVESGREFDDPGFVTCGDAVCWCLEGLIIRRTSIDPEDGRIDRDLVFDAFRNVLGEHELYRWNDARGRTVGEVIALAERVAHPTDEQQDVKP